MKREAFLERVRQAARAGQAHRAHVRRDLEPNTGYVGAGDDLCQRMAAEVIGVGGTAEVVNGIEPARAALDAFIRALGAAAALCWRHPLLERLDLASLLTGLNIERLDYERLDATPEPQRRAAMLAAGVGITGVACAIAETGTLVMAAAAGRERVASLLPPVHVAVVAESQILPDLFDLFAALDRANRAVGCVKQRADAPTFAAETSVAGAPSASVCWPLARDADRGDQRTELPSNLVLITGPSKTGDIELQLTTGVHGPGSVHAIVIRGL